MINTLQNLPERVPSKGGNKFKKAVALAIALTLFGEPAEAKTYEKQEFPTEMLASISGEYTPMTENVEQATVPNYINQAQNGVKKYYPQYEEYFEAIFITFKSANSDEKRIINEKIHENFDIFSEELNIEKDKITTILITLEKLTGGNKFTNSIETKKGNEGYDKRVEIAKEIVFDTNSSLLKRLKETKEIIEKKTIQINKLNNIIETLNSGKTNSKKEIENLLIQIEDFFLEINTRRIKNSTGLQNIIKHYISLNEKINRTPNNTGEMIINEYGKIKK